MAIILGLDPGSRFTGIGILEVEGDRINHIHHCVINASGESSFPLRISRVGLEFRKILHKYKPNIVVIEKIFLGKNADSAFKLGHARGICMYEAICFGSEVREYATRLVKKLVTGSGAADKVQVQIALERLLNIKIHGSIDASDALALAYHHSIQMEIERKINKMSLINEAVRFK